MAEFFETIYLKLTQNTLQSIIDIVLLAALLYVTFVFLKKNNATRLIKYLVIVLVLCDVFMTEFFADTTLSKICSYSLLFLPLFIVVLFPSEIRRLLWKISSPKEMQEAFGTKYSASDEELKSSIDHIVRAVQNMAKKNIGALIVIAPQYVPPHIIESGTQIDGKISSALIETIFNTKAPLHDGAMFIKGNQILATGCFLPLSQNINIDKELGTRHRAAIGVTEEHNVFAIIVSEENGVISTALNGELNRYYDSVMLTDILMQVYGLKAMASSSTIK